MNSIFRPVSLLPGLVLLLAGVGSVLALEAKPQAQFDLTLKLKLPELTRMASALLKKKYLEEDWDEYSFPNFVFSSDVVEVDYKIAVKEMALLGGSGVMNQVEGIACYCFCDAMGHENQLHFFIKKEVKNDGFDGHAAGCNICNSQAMLVFLWHNMGVTHLEIIQGLAAFLAPAQNA